MISLIIPSYNRATVLGGILSALSDQTVFTRFNCEILISIDNSDPQLEAYIDYIDQFTRIFEQVTPKVKIRLIINNTSGLVNAKRRAVKESRYNYIMMLDDDLILENNYIEELYKDITNGANIGAVSGYIVTYNPAISHTQPSIKIDDIPKTLHLQTLKIKSDNDVWRSVFGDKEQVMDWSDINKKLEPSTRYHMDYFVNSYLFKKEVYNQIDGYNIDLNSLTSAHEEVDFTYRIKKAGYQLVFNPFVRMWHWTIGAGGIYKGKDLEESKDILEKEYSDSLTTLIKSMSNY